MPLQKISAISSSLWIQQIVNLEQCKFAIFVSVPSVHFFFKGLAKHNIHWPANIQALAVGSATAEALENLNIPNIHFSEHGTSDHLLSMPQLNHIKNEHILWVKGPHGRTIIGEALTEKGAKLIGIDVYQSQDIFYPETIWTSLWQSNKIDIILISSLKILNCLWKQIPNQHRNFFQTIPLLVFSERIKLEALNFLNNPIYCCKHDKIIKALENFANLNIKG